MLVSAASCKPSRRRWPHLSTYRRKSAPNESQERSWLHPDKITQTQFIWLQLFQRIRCSLWQRAAASRPSKQSRCCCQHAPPQTTPPGPLQAQRTPVTSTRCEFCILIIPERLRNRPRWPCPQLLCLTGGKRRPLLLLLLRTHLPVAMWRRFRH